MATSAAPAAATVDEGVLDPSQQNVLTKVLSQVVQERQAQLDRLRKELHEVNWQRKSAQTAAADKLTLLHQNWLSLVSKNFQLEGVCADLEQQVSRLEARVAASAAAAGDAGGNDENDANQGNQADPVASGVAGARMNGAIAPSGDSQAGGVS